MTPKSDTGDGRLPTPFLPFCLFPLLLVFLLLLPLLLLQSFLLLQSLLLLSLSRPGSAGAPFQQPLTAPSPGSRAPTTSLGWWERRQRRGLDGTLPALSFGAPLKFPIFAPQWDHDVVAIAAICTEDLLFYLISRIAPGVNTFHPWSFSHLEVSGASSSV